MPPPLLVSGARVRHLVPSAPFQQTAILRLRPSLTVRTPPAPLFEKEGHALLCALSLDGFSPFGLHGTRLRTGLSANDHPVNIAQVEQPNILQQWFDRQKSNTSADFT